MNFSAEKASRKWADGAFRRGGAAIVTAVAALLWLGMQASPAEAARHSAGFPWDDLFRTRPVKPRVVKRRAAVPLPKPRPAEAPAVAEPEQPAVVTQPPAETARPTEPAKPAEPPKPPEPAAPQPSACRQALTEEIAIAPSIPDIHGPGGCGGEDLVRLEAIVLPDKRKVAVKPAAILRCKMATAIADWVRTDIAPLAEGLGSTVSDLDNFDSFECRGRNRVVGAQLSEHGRANALDVRAFKLANGRSISLTDRTVPRSLRETVLHSVCARFSTVLGPGSDWYHEDHIHLDLMERRNNYRICQWNVYDPLPQVAPLLPAARPEDAPPREVAAKSDGSKPDAPDADTSKRDTSKAHGSKPDATKAEDAAAPAAAAAKPQPTRKRRQSRRP
ncbi:MULTISPECIES: extensin family protein [unclassified Bradyrhizobium]|uniref:extensin family protein n=1 Tax=unclassified Bradyrhizobium TaxID=2631580 RepID=UPI002479DB92|nr:MULTISPECIES: extensin family protein [unclassified Bradyrhizobium]WGS22573.1 extensin family protein [Bradyrhizobium sp. ISRA463]WGS29556.1 extensin family protein [Bradyrhizobium sp. ISRA464]